MGLAAVGGDARGHGADAESKDRIPVGDEDGIALEEEVVDAAPMVEHGAQMVGRVETLGLGHLGPQVRHLHDPAPGFGHRLAQLANAEHGYEAGEQGAGGEHDLVGRRDGGDSVGACHRVVGHELDLAHAAR